MTRGEAALADRVGPHCARSRRPPKGKAVADMLGASRETLMDFVTSGSNAHVLARSARKQTGECDAGRIRSAPHAKHNRTFTQKVQLFLRAVPLRRR
jgi:hypothetical protein